MRDRQTEKPLHVIDPLLKFDKVSNIGMECHLNREIYCVLWTVVTRTELSDRTGFPWVAGEEHGIENTGTTRNIYEYYHKFRLQGTGLFKFYLYIYFDPN